MLGPLNYENMTIDEGVTIFSNSYVHSKTLLNNTNKYEHNNSSNRILNKKKFKRKTLLR